MKTPNVTAGNSPKSPPPGSTHLSRAPPKMDPKTNQTRIKFKLALGSPFEPGQEPKMKVVLAEVARGRRSGGSPRPPGSILGGILILKTALFRCCFKLPRQNAFCMAFDCYFVRLSFDLKDGRAARANGAYADSTTKTKGFNQFFKLCFCAGERRGEQNTHGSDKKTHATKAFKKLCLLALLVSFFRSRQPSRKKVPKMTSQSPSGTLPGTRQEGKIGLRFALGAFQGRF